jgi:hypothetical protein
LEGFLLNVHRFQIRKHLTDSSLELAYFSLELAGVNC